MNNQNGINKKNEEASVSNLAHRQENKLNVPLSVPGEEPQILLKNEELYADAIIKFREKIIQLVQNKVMSEHTASKIILEQEYNFFQQLISVEYKPEGQ